MAETAVPFEAEIVAATAEIFSTMLAQEVQAGEADTAPMEDFQESVSGVLGMSGDFQGVLAVHCPYPAARQITETLLGMPVEEIGEDVRDAVGEIANMLAGGMKTALAAQGTHLDLSVPTTVAGSGYSLNCLSRATCVIVPFRSVDNTFYVEFKYRR